MHFAKIRFKDHADGVVRNPNNLSGQHIVSVGKSILCPSHEVFPDLLRISKQVLLLWLRCNPHRLLPSFFGKLYDARNGCVQVSAIKAKTHGFVPLKRFCGEIPNSVLQAKNQKSIFWNNERKKTGQRPV